MTDLHDLDWTTLTLKAYLDERLDSLTERVDIGDARLREHIDAQAGQIAAALDAARRESQFAHESAQKAIEKAETATEKRFESVNQFREQLREQSHSFLPREVAEAQFAELRKLSDVLRDRSLPRETFDSALTEWTSWREQVNKRLDQNAGAQGFRERRQGQIQAWQIWAAGAVVAAIAIVANLVTGATV